MSASRTASLWFFDLASSTTNSSPDIRPTMHLSGKATRSLWATEMRTSSPAECPRLSLIFLKRSTSINKTVGAQPLNRDLSIAVETCSSIKPRFGKFVRASVCAESIRRCCSEALARTENITRVVTAIANTKIETALTVRSVSSVGVVRARTTTGRTSAAVVSTSRPKSGCFDRTAVCDDSVETLGCRIVADTKNKLTT